MINNYVQHEYQPCHLIHPFDQNLNINLYLGDVSSALDLQFIQASNIKTVVTAAAGMDQVSYPPESQIKHIVYSVLDHKNQNLIKFFDQFYQLVEKQIKIGSILVHCAAGISRSSTLVISYLMKKFNWPFKQAIKYVRKSRPTVLPNLGFERQLKQYEKIITQQQNRRLKSKTSESNKHNSENKSELFPEIGILGVSSTKNKILEAFRIYKRDQEMEKIHKKNIFNNHQGLKNDQRLNSLKYQHFQKFKPLSRELGQTKSVSLQQGLERNLRQYEEGGKLSSYIEVRTDNSDVISSRKHLASRNGNGLFDSAIIPIKYNTVSKPSDTLKKTNIKFSQVNTNSITINRINIFKQKYSRNNQPLSLGKPEGDQNENLMLKNDIEVNLGELKTRQNFTIKLSKVKESPTEIMTNLMSGKNAGGYLKKERLQNRRESQMRNREQGVYDEGPKKVTIKNMLFSEM